MKQAMLALSASLFIWQQVGSTDMEKFVLRRDEQACRVKVYPDVDWERYCRVAMVSGTKQWHVASRYRKFKGLLDRTYASRQDAQRAVERAVGK